eukprot:6621461-Pyramimonas_sp.AAC.2
MQEGWVYSHDGPIRRRKRGYILTMDQRQTDLCAMLAGPKGREVGESGELDKAVRKGEGKVGC